MSFQFWDFFFISSRRGPGASVADPGSGAFLTPRSGIRDGYKIKIRIRDKHPDSYFREFRNNFWFKILKFFDEDLDPESF
jgi:hypothetical protein